MDISDYGDASADIYDELMTPPPGQEVAAATFLADLAPGGRALELGVGTGRVAIPLATRGLRVHGIDASRKMLARLREKPGGEAVETSIGDFVDPAVPGPFDLVYVVYNTLFALMSQDQQVACVGNAARRLRPGGWFVVEAFFPPRARFGRQSVGRPAPPASPASPGQPGGRPETPRPDSVTQTVIGHQTLRTSTGIRVLPVRMRYAWPAELDLMARLAGLRLTDRFGGWKRQPFTEMSENHVSVYTAPTEAGPVSN